MDSYTKALINLFSPIKPIKQPYLAIVKKLINKIATLDNGTQIVITDVGVKEGDKVMVFPTLQNPKGVKI